MQTCWLAQNNRPSCILFLSGWSMDPAPFQSIPVLDHDLLMAYDYREIEPEEVLRKTGEYESVHLIAWSMGVWVAGKYFAKHKNRFASAAAINGTLTPIDDQAGIPAEPFDAMINDFSRTVLDEFYRDMFDRDEELARFFRNRPRRPLNAVLEELQTLKRLYMEQGAGKDIFDRCLAGSRDRIFPARAQLRSWGKERCERIPAPHFPFYDWESWDLIVTEGLRSCG